MGFLAKTNSRATRRSVICWAAGGSLAGLAFCIISLFRSDISKAGWFFMLIWMAVSGAIAGALVEWQLPDGCDDDEDL
jgi:hypothetical protein